MYWHTVLYMYVYLLENWYTASVVVLYFSIFFTTYQTSILKQSVVYTTLYILSSRLIYISIYLCNTQTGYKLPKLFFYYLFYFQSIKLSMLYTHFLCLQIKSDLGPAVKSAVVLCSTYCIRCIQIQMRVHVHVVGAIVVACLHYTSELRQLKLEDWIAYSFGSN